MPSFTTSPRASAFALALAIVFVLTSAASPAAQAQTYKVLYDFHNGADGANPYAGLTMDAAGNLYGTTYNGGADHAGTVFKLANKGPGWILSPLYSFQDGSDGAYPKARVIFGPDGLLYGTTNEGGAGCTSGNGCGTVFNLRPPAAACITALCPWKETVIYRFGGANDGFEPGYGDLTFDQAGNVYGTTVAGGTHGYGTVFKLTPSNGAWTKSVLYNFADAPDSEFPYSGVIFDSGGNLYGTASSGGQLSQGTVFQLKPSGSGWTERVLYSFQQGHPQSGLIFDSSGNLYGTTPVGGQHEYGTAYELSPSGGSWTYGTIFSFASPSPASPGSLTMDAAGNLYGTTQAGGAYNSGLVFRLSPSGGGWTETDLYSFAGGSDGSSPLGNVILDANRNIYGTASQGGANNNGVVWEITP